MKKIIIAFIFALSAMSMQAASAATLTLSNLFGGSVTTGSGSAVAGTATGATVAANLSTPFGNIVVQLPISTWVLTVSADASVDFSLSGNSNSLVFSSSLFDTLALTPPAVLSFGSSTTALLTAGTYYLSILSGLGNPNVPYNLNISTSAVPVPAAVWLFGSALLGLAGVRGRKSRPAFAA